MAYEDFSQKQSVAVCYTGDGKGKTSASIGLAARALGHGWRVAYIQFIKSWEVGEHKFFSQIAPVFDENFVFYKGGKGFFHAGDQSAKNVSDAEHRAAARKTYNFAFECATNGEFDLVICDEINNAVHDGLLTRADLRKLLKSREPTTSICVTGRNFPDNLLPLIDIATEMRKTKHHFDDKFLANIGIDF